MISAIQILMTQTFQSWRRIPNITNFTNMSQIYHTHIIHIANITSDKYDKYAKYPPWQKNKKYIWSQKYFLSPNTFLLFLLSPQKNVFSLSNYFPLFLLCFFFSTKKYIFLLQTFSSFSYSVLLLLQAPKIHNFRNKKLNLHSYTWSSFASVFDILRDASKKGLK